MSRFELIVTKDTRALLGIVIFTLATFNIVVIAVAIDTFFWDVFAIFLYLCLLAFLFYYYTFGTLIIEERNGRLEFEWKKKLFFNYKHIEPVALKDIEIVVMERNLFLRKIITKDRVIRFNTSKIRWKNALRFINFLKQNTNARFADSAELLAEKGYLKYMIFISRAISIACLLLLLYTFIKRGFSF